MSSKTNYIGYSGDFENLMMISDRLNLKVLEQVNESQELIMLNMFAQESNEYQLKKHIEERITEIQSWSWVFKDLLKRLDEAEEGLVYECNAVKVVVERIKNEIHERSGIGSRLGALCPLNDPVEEAIMEEYKYLHEQKKKFQRIITELLRQIAILQQTKKCIEDDIMKKEKSVTVEVKCVSLDVNRLGKSEIKKKKNRTIPLDAWEKRCDSLKKAGLEALSSAIFMKQQVKGLRLKLSTAAQAHATRVDAVLRRRLHINKTKLEELNWQKNEAFRDLESLKEEFLTADQSLFENLDQIRLTEARIADRKLKPRKEVTRDSIDMSLRGELCRLKKFSYELRNNAERINLLRKKLNEAITSIDCAADDVVQIINLDSERIRARRGESSNSSDGTYSTASMRTQPTVISISSTPTPSITGKTNVLSKNMLPPILEENENSETEIDDYPFDY